MNVAELTSSKTQRRFPNVTISNPNITVPVIVQSLMPGDVQLIVELNGKQKVVKEISPSAMNMNNILRAVGSFKYTISAGIEMTINSIEDYLKLV